MLIVMEAHATPEQAERIAAAVDRPVAGRSSLVREEA